MALPNLSELSPDVIPPPASTNIQTIERMNNQTSERFPWRFVVFYCKLVLFSDMLLWLLCIIAWLIDDYVCFRHVFEFLEALARVISAQPCLLFIQPFLISGQSPNKKHRRFSERLYNKLILYYCCPIKWLLWGIVWRCLVKKIKLNKRADFPKKRVSPDFSLHNKYSYRAAITVFSVLSVKEYNICKTKIFAEEMYGLAA